MLSTFILSCNLENKKQTKMESNNELEATFKTYRTDSVDIQKVIGKDFFFYNDYKIKNGKLLVEGMEEKNRFSDEATKLIFIIDIKSKKLISTIMDPAKDYVDLAFDMVDDTTLLIMHSLTNDEIYLINIFNQKVEKQHIQFDESANRPHIIDAIGKQLFMTCNVYGFSVADLSSLKGKVFVNSSFSTSQSVVSYPLDEHLNLLSGTVKYDSLYNEKITLYAIDNLGNTKWEKELPAINYANDYSGAFTFFNFKNGFIVRYYNKIEYWDKKLGTLIWEFANEHPISQINLVGNKLIVYSYFNSTGMIPSDDEVRNQKIKENVIENYHILNLDTGNIIWSKESKGESSKFGIIAQILLIGNNKHIEIINFGDNFSTKLYDNTISKWDEVFFKQIIDTKTGKLYLEVNEVLYW